MPSNSIIQAPSVDATCAVVASVVIIQNGRILLVQEGHHRVHGKWSLPGGHVEQGETIEESAIREAKEEAGYDIELETALPILHSSVEAPVMHPFTAKIVGGEPTPQVDDILAVQWFSVDKVRSGQVDLRNSHYIFSSLDALGL